MAAVVAADCRLCGLEHWQWRAVFLWTPLLLILLILLILFVGLAPLNSQKGCRLRSKRVVVEGEGQHILCSPNLPSYLTVIINEKDQLTIRLINMRVTA